MKYSVITFLLLFTSIVYSQQKQAVNVSFVKQIDLKEAKTKDWAVQVQHMIAPSPDGDSYRSFLLRKKLEIEANNPKTGRTITNRSITSEDTLKLGKSFLTNAGGHGIPNDNSMAISNDGILISAFNSAIFIQDTEADTMIAEVSLNFFRDQLSGYTGHSFDPKMIYDPVEDRFILVFLVGSTVATSNIITCFSSTSNPMDPWNIYALSGNPLNDTSWSDYPAISLTNNDLFITMNLLVEGGPWQTSFKQTVIWQLDKVDGYAGDTVVATDLWSEISEGGINIRNMHPVRGGFDLKGPNQYFLSNRNFATQSDSIYLIEVTNSVASGTSQLNVHLLKADLPYYLAPRANQMQGSNRFFQTNDSRVLGGILENKTIQFVQNCLHPPTGHVAVYHGVIENPSENPTTVKGNYIYHDSLELGYPNIVYGGIVPNEKKALIGFNHSSKWYYPGHSAIYFDGDNYSKLKILKKGDNIVASQFSPNQRWGDYFGLQRKYNESCKVWLTGYYGSLSRDNNSWASEIYLPGDCFDERPTTLTPQQNGVAFPNPTKDYMEAHFSLDAEKEIKAELLDRNGKLVKVLYEDIAKAGDNRIQFSTELLTPGVYVLRIYSNKEKILTKKVVKN